MTDEPKAHRGLDLTETDDKSWPCKRCGRLETETCNGASYSTQDRCPHGRYIPRPKELTDKMIEGCKLVTKSIGPYAKTNA